MLCRKPFHKRGATFGCGQCMHCRYNRRRIWTHRIMLEALVHPRASFLTLTYKNVPDDGSLSPVDLQLWLKRLRKSVGPCRYFAVGEYGDDNWRPHYHLALFGHGREISEEVRKTWGLGFTLTADLTYESAGYVCGYVTKKMTSVKDERLAGRYPEFARMSLKPGIGALSVHSISSALSSKWGRDEVSRSGDVPDSLQHGRRKMPLGRYLRSRLRDELGVEGCNREEVFKKTAEMLNMRQNYLLDQASKGTFPAFLEAKVNQRRKNIEKRSEIFSQEKRRNVT